jgi:hypothetical protein
VIDQPSPAYFPDHWPDTVTRNEALQPDPSNGVDVSNDIVGVRRVFELLALAVERTKGTLQIIVLEHAGRITWEGISAVHFVDNWRGDKYLIPLEWGD